MTYEHFESVRARPRKTLNVKEISLANISRDVSSFIELIYGPTDVCHYLPLLCIWVVG